MVDPHGDLAERAASRLEAMRVPTVVVDFGRDDLPGWNLSVPESGVDTITWASLLKDIVRDLWPDMPEETSGHRSRGRSAWPSDCSSKTPRDRSR